MNDIDGILRKVRGLLAKAESTTNEHERDAFLAKAQELQAKYAVDAEMVGAINPDRREGIGHIRLVEERNSKNVKAKRELVMWLAQVFNGKVIMGPRRAYLEVWAHETDLKIIEMMYGSLLLQMQTAMARDEATYGLYGGLSSWRVSYAHGYVRRVGNRLAAQHDRATADAAAAAGVSTALVLVDRSALVTNAQQAFYGDGLKKARKIPTQAGANAHGFYSGVEAANQADLGQQRMGSGQSRPVLGS